MHFINILKLFLIQSKYNIQNFQLKRNHGLIVSARHLFISSTRQLVDRRQQTSENERVCIEHVLGSLCFVFWNRTGLIQFRNQPSCHECTRQPHAFIIPSVDSNTNICIIRIPICSPIPSHWYGKRGHPLYRVLLFPCAIFITSFFSFPDSTSEWCQCWNVVQDDENVILVLYFNRLDILRTIPSFMYEVVRCYDVTVYRESNVLLFFGDVMPNFWVQHSEYKYKRQCCSFWLRDLPPFTLYLVCW